MRRHVEVVLDFVCVHSYLGFTRFLRAVEEHRRTGGEVVVRFAPFQLRPQASPGGEPLFEVHERERGAAVAREIAESTFGAEDGLRVDLRRAIFTNTFDAHRLLAAASEQDRGEEMAERLFRAYFTDGLNIADPHTLEALADDVGVAPPTGGADSLRAELDRVRSLGVEMPPVFRFDHGRAVSGSSDVARFLAELAEAA
ncbi:DsbA family oxidoreductase [Saccharopolyspora mangrovi]|uniref:DsbA family protein n=1 Tax=Saccharopolyspora mangrovi TaxID=3082379 RepID=A0ABU6A8F6_9PSEU|nr:DsbA family protein [Saccharopolyspora sp. S2-29]MEB3367679.1 DsbA family protein [Saccharopolyspora sp. S2-29]